MLHNFVSDLKCCFSKIICKEQAKGKEVSEVATEERGHESGHGACDVFIS